MKLIKTAQFSLILLALVLSSCASSKNFGSNSDLTVQNSFQTTNSAKIITSNERVSYEIPNSRIPRKALRRLTLEQAKKKVQDEAVMELGIAVIVDPKYSYDGKGRKIKRIKVAGYAGTYDFGTQADK